MIISAYCRLNPLFLFLFYTGILLCSDISAAEPVVQNNQSEPPFRAKEQATHKFTLPPVLFKQTEANRIPTTQGVLIKKINTLGNTLLSHAELSEISTPYLNRNYLTLICKNYVMSLPHAI